MATQIDEKASYIFKRNFKSSIRLNHNHWLTKACCDYLLHPKIGRPGTSARIADVGAGTGIWLFETAESLPDTVQLDGFDISSEQYPPQAWWPKNVNLYVHDAFKPFPKELQGGYDIINARFFLCLVNDDNVELLLENLVSLLKPGGYLQWFEPNANEVSSRKDNPNASSTEFVQWQAEKFRKPTQTSSFNWLVQMPTLFEKYGLSLEAREDHPTKKHLMLPWVQTMLLGYEDVVLNPQLSGTEAANEMNRQIAGLSKEYADGVALDTSFLCFVGRKV